MDSVSAMILAGGRGKRMGLLCNRRPKLALPFAVNYRVIDFSLSNCLNSRIDNIAVLTGYQRSYLGKYLKRWQSTNARHKNIFTLEPQNGSYSGTADAVFQNLNYLSEQNSDLVLVLAADHIYKMDYRKMIDFHRTMQADTTVAVVQVPIEKASQFGTVITSPDNRITDFVEKPYRPASNLVSMGIYVFNRQRLNQRLNEDAEDPDSVHDFGHVVLPKMVSQDRVFAYRFEDFWEDIGTPEAYHKTNIEILQDHPAFSLNGHWPVFTVDKKQAEFKTSADRRIHNAIISPGCIIKGRVENSILSPGVWVGEGAVIKDSVIMNNASIGGHTRVANCILDEDTVIGEYCQIGLETDPGSENAEITVIGQNIKIPFHTEINNSSKIGERDKIHASSGIGLPQIVQPYLDPVIFA